MSERDDDKDLLAALRDVARAQDDDADALWAAVQEGPAQEVPESAEGLDLEGLAPLDAHERAAMTDALFGLGASVEASPAPPEPPAAPVIDLSARRRRRFVSGGLGLALAAGLAMMVFGRAATLPEYALEVRAGEQVLRGEETASQVFVEGSVLSAVLRPAVRSAQALDIAVVLEPADGPAVRLDLPAQFSANGAIRVRAVVGRDIPVGPGTHRLVFLVAPQGDLPSDPVAARAAAPSGGRRMQYVFQVSKRD